MEGSPSTSTTTFGFSFTAKIEAILKKHVDALGRIRDPFVRDQYHIFNLENQSISSLIIMNSCFLIISTLYFITSLLGIIDLLWMFPHENHHTSLWISAALFMLVLVINVFAWYMRYSISRQVNPQEDGLVVESKKRMVVYQQAVVLVLHVVFCLDLINRVVAGPCDNDNNRISYATYCNPVADSKALPGDGSQLVMVVPLLFLLATHGAYFAFALMLWSMSLLTLVFCIVFSSAIASIMSLVIYSMASITTLVLAKRLNLFLFFCGQQLQATLAAREKAVDEANASEMRHMIANVAHDLKTPLASLFCGIEFVEQVLTDLKQKLPEGDPDFTLSRPGVDELMFSINHSIVNMKTSNTFMLMAINRCLDYTKASKGFKLMPKYETVELVEALQLPMNCMKDVENGVAISLESLPTDICSHIITDKQWLQENILCLLSNAVKYSCGGEVRLSVSVTSTIPEGCGGHGKEDGNYNTVASRDYNAYTWAALSLSRSSKSSRNLPVNTSYLLIEVEDNGIGLSEEAMTALFSPFKQAQRLAGGTGLGLFSLAKRVDALDGLYGVRRRRDGGEGSLFWFQIPYRPDQQAALFMQQACRPHSLLADSNVPTVAAIQKQLHQALASSPGSVEESSNTTPAVASGRSPSLVCSEQADVPDPSVAASTRLVGSFLEPASVPELDILVVDDSPTIRKTVSMMLKRSKHEVFTAVNGAEAVKVFLKRLEEHGRGFDVILMDLQMPVMDGLEATRRLRQLGHDSQRGDGGEGGHSCWSPRSSEVLKKLHANRCEKMKSGCEKLLPFHQIIIAFSANSDVETATEAYRAGADAFIAKPFVMDTFYHTYRRVQEKVPKGDALLYYI